VTTCGGPLSEAARWEASAVGIQDVITMTRAAGLYRALAGTVYMGSPSLSMPTRLVMLIPQHNASFLCFMATG
jgi:hypothetical protein